MSDAAQDEPPATRATDTRGVVVEERARVSVLRLSRPAARNPLSGRTLDELETAVATLAARADIAALVFTGTDDVFAAGANIRELAALTPAAALAFARRGQRLMQLIADAPQLTVAAVNGYCMGGGLDLALACDLRVAAPNAIFAHPGARLGLITGWGGTQRLPRLVGPARALDIFLTARRVSAHEAHEIGLVHRVGTPVLTLALELAARAYGPQT